MKTRPLAAALLAALLAAASARADDATPGVSITPAPVAVTVESDGSATVTLKDGSLYRGALVERIVSDHVTLKMATGEVKRFAWAELAPAEAQAPAASPQPAAKVAPPLEAPGVLVTLTGDPGVHLERVTGTESGGAWVLMQSNSTSSWGSGWAGHGQGGMSVLYGAVCQAPCNVRVDSSYVYRVAGPGYTSTGTFQVSGDAVRIQAHMGSMAQLVVGWLLFGGGLGVGAVGLIGGGLCASAPNCTSTGWFIAGTVGLAAAVGGLVMVLTSGSSVELDGQPVGMRIAPGVALTPRGVTF